MDWSVGRKRTTGSLNPAGSMMPGLYRKIQIHRAPLAGAAEPECKKICKWTVTA
jgi:hypothetical protein